MARAHARAAGRDGGRGVILDAQVHLWERDRPDRPYNGISEPNLSHPFGPERMLPLMDEAGVDRVVIVPPGFMDPHNDYALECAERYPERFGVMGLLLPGAPGSAERVATWLRQPGMLGVRTHVNARQRARWASEELAESFWAACERHEVPVAVFAAGEAEYLEGVLMRHPGLRLVLDHLGLPQIDAGFRREDLETMRRLARRPGVVVKLSTLPSTLIVKVPPAVSSGISLPSRARSAMSVVSRERSSRLLSATSFTTGTISPSLRDTATPMLTWSK